MTKKVVISNIKAGFGNQLFQFATGYAISKRIDAQFKLDLRFYEGENKNLFRLKNINLEYQEANLDEVKNLRNVDSSPLFFRVLYKLNIRSKYRKRSHIFDDFDLFKPNKQLLKTKNSIYIDSWCTSMEYFSHLKEELNNMFSMKGSFSKQAEHFLQKIKNSESVAIHIRRGDYLGLQHYFKVLEINYFNTAIDIVNSQLNDPHFFVFSNDLIWVKDQMKNRCEKIIFVELGDDSGNIASTDIEEFFLMKECSHHIISNSSYSWWPAFLNLKSNKIVITPKVWYNDVNAQKTYSNHPLIENSWIQI